MPLHRTVALVLQGPRKDARWLSSHPLRSMADPLACNDATQQSLSSLSPRTVTDSQYAYAIDGYQTTHNPNQWQSSCFCNQQQGHACLNIQSSRCGRIFAEFLPTLRWLSAREICAGGRPDDVAVGPQLIKRVEGSWTQMVARQHSSYE